LNKIAPTPARGNRGMMIDLAGVARSKDAVFSLAEALDRAPAFSNASLKSIQEQPDGIEFMMEVVFDPEPPATIDAARAGNPPSVPSPKAPGPPASGAAKTP
ncbi:MAG: PilN domain-containing protein, partial [Vicinamibacteria bacterium]